MSGHMHDAIAAYAIDALDDAERVRMTADLLEHVSACEECRADFLQTRETAAELALAATPVPVSASLRQRLMGEVRDIPQERPVRAPSLALRRRVVFLVAAAALLGALAAWNLVLSSNVRDLRARSKARDVALQLLNDAGTSKVVLTRDHGFGSMQIAVGKDGTAVLVGTVLPLLPAGRLMEVWVMRDGALIPSVTFRPVRGTTIVVFRIEPSRDSAVAVTIERRRELKPTQAPIFHTEI